MKTDMKINLIINDNGDLKFESQSLKSTLE